jgi:hypothetical protein
MDTHDAQKAAQTKLFLCLLKMNFCIKVAQYRTAEEKKPKSTVFEFALFILFIFSWRR